MEGGAGVADAGMALDEVDAGDGSDGGETPRDSFHARILSSTLLGAMRGGHRAPDASPGTAVFASQGTVVLAVLLQVLQAVLPRRLARGLRQVGTEDRDSAETRPSSPRSPRPGTRAGDARDARAGEEGAMARGCAPPHRERHLRGASNDAWTTRDAECERPPRRRQRRSRVTEHVDEIRNPLGSRRSASAVETVV